MPGGSVIAQPPSVPFAGASDGNGQAPLTASVDGADRTCVPAGPITLTADADRFQTATVMATVPAQGAIDVPIVMVCIS